MQVCLCVGRGLGRMSRPRDSDPEQLCALAQVDLHKKVEG